MLGSLDVPTQSTCRLCISVRVSRELIQESPVLGRVVHRSHD